jgi:hypothetical protein
MSKQNAEEDYIKTPISVLSYISELEAERDALRAELNKVHKKAAFYRCCALSGEVPKDGAEPQE